MTVSMGTNLICCFNLNFRQLELETATIIA